MIQQHNGFIRVDSQPDQGTVFNIYFPSIKTQIEEIKPAYQEIPGGTETILVAEDNKEVRNFTKEILTRKGYTVIEAIDGEQALQKFREHQDSLDLIILDVVMPKKNGKEVYEAIIKEKPKIKVLFTSGYTGDVVIDKGIDDGVEFISKPLSLKELLLKVREVLDK
ncbi:MAG: hypothetical protein C0407_13840 [Desulfobacca sp.]|nr:hypothetical protein [Desulfobacca sp.]